MQFSIVGYGTFITRGLWKDKKNVEVCLVPDFIRIFPEGHWFPFGLPFKGKSFWALKFEVNDQELKQLDYYEGVDSGLFKRIDTEIILKNNTKSSALIYIPTEKTIDTLHLTPELDSEDRWKNEIRKNSEVVKKFPELLL
jgi:gamma-glutamylcyclotransferase (GGCT)/AIG2-like uncharacterized protein YtfP